MAKLPTVSSQQVIGALQHAGFEIHRKRGKGSHTLLLRRDPQSVAITVPHRKEMRKGTLRAILRQADLTVDQFIELLSE